MIRVFSAGPECLEKSTVDDIARQLRENSGVALCFTVPVGGEEPNGLMKDLMEVRAALREILHHYHCPPYTALYQPISAAPIIPGWHGAWVTLTPTPKRRDSISPIPIRKSRAHHDTRRRRADSSDC